ncbi:MAG: DinB family protein [Dehalococcoidia bacterium]
MTTIAEFLRASFRNLHRSLDASVQDLTPEQLHFVPPGSAANHIGNTLWHYVRTEDNIVQFILQERKPTVWIEGGYHEKFGLDKVAQGTGLSTEDAQAMRLPPLDDWMAYQQAVWQSTDGYLASLAGSALDETVTVRPFGEIPKQQALGQVCLTHGHAHFGEICVLRVLQGLPSGLN